MSAQIAIIVPLFEEEKNVAPSSPNWRAYSPPNAGPGKLFWWTTAVPMAPGGRF